MEALYKGWTTEEFERTINAIANNEFYPSDNNTLLTTLISEYPTNLSCNEVYDNQIFDFGVFNQVSTINYNSGTFPGSVDVLVNELGDCLDLYIDNIDNAASNASGASTVASYSAAAVGVTGVGISIAAYLKALAGILKLAEVGLNTASIYNSWYGYQRVGASYYRTMHHDLLDDLLPTLSERLLPSEPCPIEYFNDALGEYNVSKANYTTSINNIRQAVLSNDMSNMYNLFDILTDSDSILTKSLIKCSHPVKSIYNVAIDSISSFQGEYIETLLIDTGDDITERAALLTYIMAFVFDPNSQEVKDSIVITMDEVLENLDDIYVGYEEIYNLTNELPCYAYLSLNPNREFINVDMFQDMTIDLVNVSPLTSEDLYAKVFIYDFGTYTEYDSIYVGNLNPNETTSVNFDFSGVIVDSILLYEITFYSPNTVVQGVGGTLHNENINRILDCSDFLDEGYSHLFILEDSLEAGDTLLAFPQSIEENVTYEWYLDGNLIGTEDTINYIMSGGDNVELMLTATLDSCTYETTTIINRTVNCNFVGVGVDIYCEDMDTEEIDDDVFYFTLEPNGDNFSGSYTVSGDVDIPNIPYGVSPMAYGPYLTGTVLNITLTDDADPTCSFSTTIEYVCGGGGVPTVSEWGLIILALLLLNLGVLYIRQTEIRIEQA